MSDEERLDWICNQIDIVSAAASKQVLDTLALDDAWRLEKTERGRKLAFRKAVDEAMEQ